MGYSSASNVVNILAAQVPAQPTAPTTTFNGIDNSIVIDWVAPDDGGSPITSYVIVIRQSDGVTYT